MRRAILKPSLPPFQYPTQDYLRVEKMGAENFAPLTVRRRAVYFDQSSIPRSYTPYFERVGKCKACTNYHFPEYENCAAGWNRPLLRMPAPRVVKIKPVVPVVEKVLATGAQRAGFACTSFDDMPNAFRTYFKAKGACAQCGYFHFDEYHGCGVFNNSTEPEPEPITKPQRRKFNFDE